jgi:hypothetical protein
MKGTIFSKPLEYNIDIAGEKWSQGDKVKGTMKIKNHGADNVTLSALQVVLASGNYKKIKAKDKKGWESLAEVTLGESIALNPNEEKEFPWEFKLAENSRITDKDGSLYVTFSDTKNAEWPVGMLELAVHPKQIILQFLEIFENFIRFKVAQTKYAKGMVEVKMNPPKSRELSNVEGLVLRIQEVEKTLKLEYNFTVSVLDMAGGAMTAEKKTKQFEQSFTSKQYLIYGDSINQDFLIESIQSILKEVKTKLL